MKVFQSTLKLEIKTLWAQITSTYLRKLTTSLLLFPIGRLLSAAIYNNYTFLPLATLEVKILNEE